MPTTSYVPTERIYSEIIYGIDVIVDFRNLSIWFQDSKYSIRSCTCGYVLSNKINVSTRVVQHKVPYKHVHTSCKRKQECRVCFLMIKWNQITCMQDNTNSLMQNYSNTYSEHLGRAIQKRVFGHMRTSAPVSLFVAWLWLKHQK